MNVKDGYDNPDTVSARAKGFLLMIEKFQTKVGLSSLFTAQTVLIEMYY